MVDSNAHSDQLNEHMMDDYSHIGDESIQYDEEDPINLDDLSRHPRSAYHSNRVLEANDQREDHNQTREVTDQQLIDSFPYVDDDIQREVVRGNPHTDDEMNRFLRPFGTNPRQEDDSYSAIMKQWNDERENQERQKNEAINSAQEISDKRKVVGLYHNVPGDFAETLIFYDPFTFNSIVDEYMDAIISNVDNRSVDEWLEILKRFNEYHRDDSLIPRSHRIFLKRLEDGPFDYMTQSDWELLVKVEGFMYYEWSVYPDVRAITVPVNEENDEYYETFRVYVIGIGWAVAGSIVDAIFQTRDPFYTINETVLQMLIAITGQLWALLPHISVPLLHGKKRLVINNGRSWSFREQMLATVAMTISLGYPYAQDVIIVLSNKNFVNQKGADNFGFILLLVLSTEFMGFAIAGLQRTFFVYPSKMVFFHSLYVNSLNRALVTREPREKVNGWILKRWEFFYFFTVLWFGWYWVINVAFKALSDFDWPTWISPDDVNLNAITGTSYGLAMFPISTFDPSLINFSSLYTPWNALWQYTAGFLVTTFAVIIIWYKNVANTGYLPINVTTMHDNMGNQYNLSRIVNSNNTFNLKAYENYSMVFYGATGFVGKGVTFMYYPAQFVSCALNYWGDFLSSCKAFKFEFFYKNDTKVINGFDDRFSRTARNHPEAPEWWFFVIFFICFGVAIAVVEHWSFVKTSVYSLVLSCCIAVAFIYPMITLRARTTLSFDVKPLLMLINGMIFEANPIGLMTSTLYGSALSLQNDAYIDNLKVGHYAGLCPRVLFRCQALSLLLCSIVQAGIVQWQAAGKFKPEFCNPTLHNNTRFSCVSTRDNFNDALYLAAASPKRIFHDHPYLKWTFLLGALYPLPLWIIRKLAFHMKSTRFFQMINDSDILITLDEMVWLNPGLSWLPMNSWQIVGSNFVVGITWHKWIKPSYPQWFAKYTYLFYTTMLVSYSFGELIAAIAFDKLNSLDVSWWGNDVNSRTMDTNFLGARLQIPKKGYFGPDKGTFNSRI